MVAVSPAILSMDFRKTTAINCRTTFDSDLFGSLPEPSVRRVAAMPDERLYRMAAVRCTGNPSVCRTGEFCYRIAADPIYRCQIDWQGSEAWAAQGQEF